MSICTYVEVPNPQTSSYIGKTSARQWSPYKLSLLCLYLEVSFAPRPAAGLHIHMNVIKCREPGVRVTTGSETPVWDCGTRNHEAREHSLLLANECASIPDAIEYMFLNQGNDTSRGAIKFPPGVGYHVGGDSDRNYIILLTHYPKKPEKGYTGLSEIMMELTTGEDGMKPVGYANLGVRGFVPPLSLGKTVGSRLLDQPIRMHLLFASPHAHGMAVNHWMLIRDKEGRDTPIVDQDARIDPYYRRLGDVIVVKGETIVYGCVFKNETPDLIRVW